MEPAQTGEGFILVVDDSADLRATMEEILDVAGYRVMTAGNGLEALCYLRSGKRPVLILLDLAMPVMSGWEFLAERERDARWRLIPVIIISGEAALRRHAAELNVADHFEKPVPVTALLGRVREFVRDGAEGRQVQ